MVYTFICVICKDIFDTKDKRRKCCTVKCANKYIRILKTGKPRSKETREKISKSRIGKYCGINHPRYNVKLTEETKDRISDTIKETYKHIKHPRLGKTFTEESKRKISNALLGKYIGELAPNWQGGKTLKNKFLRQLSSYSVWRTKVFQRDNYTCQISNQVGGKLIAHHLESYNSNILLRLNVNNGVTMTRELHNNFHKIYGKRNNTRKQWEEFKNKVEL